MQLILFISKCFCEIEQNGVESEHYLYSVLANSIFYPICFAVLTHTLREIPQNKGNYRIRHTHVALLDNLYAVKIGVSLSTECNNSLVPFQQNSLFSTSYCLTDAPSMIVK